VSFSCFVYKTAFAEGITSARLFTELYSEYIFNSNTYVILSKQRISNAWKTPNAGSLHT